MRALFQVLAAHPDGLAASQAIAEVERQTPPTPFEEGEFPGSPGVRRFEKIISFSTIGPVKAGWLVKNKGQWSLTHEGQRALRRFTDPAEFTRESDGLYRVWKKSASAGRRRP